MFQSLPSYDDFFGGLHNCNPIEKTHSDYQNLIESGCNSETAIKNSNLQKRLPPGKATMLIYSMYEALEICNHSRTFFPRTKSKM